MTAQQMLSRSPSAPRRPPIEPRLQARRVEVARDAGRRRLRRLVAVVAVVLVLAGAFAVTRSPLLDVDHLTVTGASHLGVREVRTASGISRTEPMLSVEPGAAAHRLERLSWVADATVTRTWPGTITIAVLERVPVAIVGSGSGARLLDGSGRVLGPVSGGAQLPVLAGHVPAGPVAGSTLRRLTNVVSELPPDLAKQVDSAFVGPQGVTLVLHDGIRVLFADGHRLTAKIDALNTLLARVDRSKVARIDLTVPSAVALTPRTAGGA